MPDKSETDILTIDLFHLDKECATQTEQFAEAGLKYAESNYKYRDAKLSLDVLKAEKAHDIRLHSEKYNLDKVTDKSVEMAVTGNKEVIKAEETLNEAELEMEKTKAIRNAWGQRGSMLQAEIDLWTSNYYAATDGANATRNDKAIKKAKKGD